MNIVVCLWLFPSWCMVSKDAQSQKSCLKRHYKELLLLNINVEKEFLIEKHGTVMFHEN